MVVHIYIEDLYIEDEEWDEKRCLYNNDNSACSFGYWISFIGLSMSCALMICEAKLHRISSIKMRRWAVLLDLGFSGLNTNAN